MEPQLHAQIGTEVPINQERGICVLILGNHILQVEYVITLIYVESYRYLGVAIGDVEANLVRSH